MIAITPVFDPSPDAVLYGLGFAIVLSLAGYVLTMALIKRWSH